MFESELPRSVLGLIDHRVYPSPDTSVAACSNGTKTNVLRPSSERSDAYLIMSCGRPKLKRILDSCPVDGCLPLVEPLFHARVLPLDLQGLLDPLLGHNLEPNFRLKPLHEDGRSNTEHAAESQNRGDRREAGALLDLDDRRPLVAGEKSQLILRQAKLKASFREDRSEGIPGSDRMLFALSH